MPDISVPFGFELPIEGELFSTPLIRRNFQLTNDLFKESPNMSNTPEGKRPKIWTGFVSLTKGAGGEDKDAAYATDATGVGGIWLGSNGTPTFEAIQSVQLTGEHAPNQPQFAHVPTVAQVSTTRIKFRSRRQDGSAWANGYANIGMYVTITGY